MDISNFYLNTLLKRKEYVRIKLAYFHKSMMKHYKLKEIAKDGWMYVEVSKEMYGLPQAGILTQKLNAAGYHYHQSHQYTPGPLDARVETSLFRTCC